MCASDPGVGRVLERQLAAFGVHLAGPRGARRRCTSPRRAAAGLRLARRSSWATTGQVSP